MSKVKRPYTDEQCNVICQYGSTLLKRLYDATNKTYDYSNEITHCLDKCIESGAFEKYCSVEMDTGNSDISSNQEIMCLIRDIYYQRRSQYLVSELQDLMNNYEHQIREWMKSMQAGANRWKWLLLAVSAKEQAVNAYGMLTGEVYHEFVRSANSMLGELENNSNVSQDLIVSDYTANRMFYSSILATYERSRHRRKQSIPCIQTIISKYDLYSEDIPDYSSQDILSRVKEQADSYREEKTIELMDRIPLSDLLGDSDQECIDVCRREGITTAGKAYIRRNTVLNSYSFWGAKQLLELTYKKMKSKTKVSISSDDRNRNSTSLVRSIYIYLGKSGIYEKLESAIGNRFDIIDVKKELLYQIRNGMKWFLMQDNEKKQYIDAYTYIKRSLDDTFWDDIEDCIIELKKPAPSDDKVWEAYIENPIQYASVLEKVLDRRVIQSVDKTQSDEARSNDESYGLSNEMANSVAKEIVSEDGLNCMLRNYQLWGVKYILHQKNVLLGDEMGLGKTVQAIAAMVALKNRGENRFLVVCPASVLQNWCMEIETKSTLKAIQIYGSQKKALYDEWLLKGGVGVTTYETLRGLDLNGVFYVDMFVVDEAHYIKNPNAKRSQAVEMVCGKAKRILFMTGTPIENRVDEMIRLIDILNYKVSIELKSSSLCDSPYWFRRIAMPVYYRRKRDDVLKELPELIESDEWCSMTSTDEAYYKKSVLSQNFMATRRVSWSDPELNGSSKNHRMEEIIEEASRERRKIIIFSYFLDTIEHIQKYYGDKCLQPITGAVPPARRQEILNAFDKSSEGTILLAQIMTGGTGLNIQAASVVIICEPQFKPSTESQAISRSYRMGQTRNVLVYRLLCKETVDERIRELLHQKQQIFDDYADISEAARADKKQYIDDVHITDSEFKSIMKKEYERYAG